MGYGAMDLWCWCKEKKIAHKGTFRVYVCILLEDWGEVRLSILAPKDLCLTIIGKKGWGVVGRWRDHIWLFCPAVVAKVWTIWVTVEMEGRWGCLEFCFRGRSQWNLLRNCWVEAGIVSTSGSAEVT